MKKGIEIMDKNARIPGGEALMYKVTQTWKMVVTVETARWPAVLEYNKAICAISRSGKVGPAVEMWVKKFGLNQELLWDTYKDCHRDISVSRIGRDDS